MNFLAQHPIVPYLVGNCKRSMNTSANVTNPAAAAPPTINLGPPRPCLKPTALDKVFLRWSGHFGTPEQIPIRLDGEIVHRARSYGLIRLNLGLLLVTVLLSAGMVYSGKSAAERGESLQQQNLDWHRHINDRWAAHESPSAPF